MSLNKSRWINGIGLAITMIIAVLVRLRYMRDGLTYDECQHYLVAQSPFFDDFLREFRAVPHPPLPYLLMKPCIHWGSSVALVRLLSLVSGLMAIILGYVLLRCTIKRFWPVQLGTFFISIVPPFVEQSVEARHYSLCLVFVWLGLLQHFRMYRRGYGRFADHLLLAIIQFFLLLTEYSAVFHLVALATVLYVPFIVASVKSRQWLTLVAYLIPQTLVVSLGMGLFVWQFRGHVPVFAHTAPYMYSGTPTDMMGIVRFFLRGFPDLLYGLAPKPFGLVLAVTWLLPFIRRFDGSFMAGYCRLLSYYAVVGVGLAFLAALLKHFPFGGFSRHTIAIAPAMLLNSVVVLTMVVSEAIPKKNHRIIAGIAIICLIVPTVLDRLNDRFDDHKRYSGFREDVAPHYYGSPSPIVANARGRAVASWWLLAGRRPRLVEQTSNECRTFDYQGIDLVECDTPLTALESAMNYVGAQGQCWMVLAYLDGSEEASRFYELLGEGGMDRRTTAVVIQKLYDDDEFVLPTVIAKLQRR